MKTTEAYYEKLRKAGETEDITGNPNPDYTLPFYQNIFRLMEQYHKEASQEEAKERYGKACGLYYNIDDDSSVMDCLRLAAGLPPQPNTPELLHSSRGNILVDQSPSGNDCKDGSGTPQPNTDSPDCTLEDRIRNA